MTAKDLIDLLSTVPSDLPVVATWEGTFYTIEPDGVTVRNNVVVIDVDGDHGPSERLYDLDDARP